MSRLIDQEYDSSGNLVAVMIEDDGYACEFELVKHGKWIKGMLPTYGGWKCSLCNKSMVLSKPNYCPNCGAKMDAEEEHGNNT